MGESKSFDQSKQQVLTNLYQDHLDFSPKGSVDLPVRELVWLINQHSCYFTTSSCSGRVSLSVPNETDGNKGVKWLFVKHGYMWKEELRPFITESPKQGLLTLKCEPFIMHIKCKTIEDGRSLHHLALESGYRESGLTLGGKGNVMLAIRTTSFNLEFPIALDGHSIIKEDYLDLIVAEVNRRMRANFDRIHLFFLKLKNHWQWPLFLLHSESQLPSSETVRLGISRHHWKRWGHSVAVVQSHATDERLVVSGGQGIENRQDRDDLESFKSSRNISTLQSLLSHSITAAVVPPLFLADFPQHVHGQLLSFAQRDKHFLLLSGGRLSPMQPLPCLRLFQWLPATNTNASSQYSVFEQWEEVGEIPSPRWGHSLLALSDHRFLLFGGRNQQQVFDDVFFLEIQWKEQSLSCCWSRVSLSQTSSSAIAFRRFFHATCLIKLDLETQNIIPSSPHTEEEEEEEAVVLIHGGLTSLSEPIPAAEAFLFDVKTLAVREVTLPQSLPRFGHSLTPLDGKCLLLLGGYDAGLGDSHTSSSDTNSNPGYLLDYSLDYSPQIPSKELSIAIRPISVFSFQREERDWRPLLALPCQRCRCHQQVALSRSSDSDRDSQSLFIIGGGAMTLAFGNHYCQALKLEMPVRNFNLWRESPSPLPLLLEEEKSRGIEAIVANPPLSPSTNSTSHPPEKKKREEKSLYSLIIPVKEVKKMKTWLEAQSLYDKQRKIVSLSSLLSSLACCEVLDLKSLLTSSLLPPQRTAIESYFLSDQTEEEVSLMLVPLSERGRLLLLQEEHHHNHHLVLQSLLQWYRHPSLLVASETTNHYNNSTSNGNNGPMKEEEPEKGFVQYGERGASDYLRSLILDHPRYQDLAKEMPSKYEVVADVLMMPETALLSSDWMVLSGGQLWEVLLTRYFPKISRVARKRLIEKSLMRQSQVLLLYVSTAFREKVQQMTAKRPVCFCGTRHYLVSESSSIAQDSSSSNSYEGYGWVTLIENRIKFSFDLTKVMFCSGNITERMRMEKLTHFRANEVIFDLYCGVGYYTLPLLKYHGSRIAAYYACEWNPNSITALYHNLINNDLLPPVSSSSSRAESRRVVYDFSAQSETPLSASDWDQLQAPLRSLDSPRPPLAERVSILYGNNAISTLSFEDVADRVLLGLLPSSENGWEIAIRLIHREKGGILHLHENVLDKDLQQFTQEKLLVKLKQYCEKYQKQMEIRVLHLEKVKSYAPHVFHYVFDIALTPIASTTSDLSSTYSEK